MIIFIDSIARRDGRYGNQLHTCLDFMFARLDTTERVIATDGVLGSSQEGWHCVLRFRSNIDEERA